MPLTPKVLLIMSDLSKELNLNLMLHHSRCKEEIENNRIKIKIKIKDKVPTGIMLEAMAAETIEGGIMEDVAEDVVVVIMEIVVDINRIKMDRRHRKVEVELIGIMIQRQLQLEVIVEEVMTSAVVVEVVLIITIAVEISVVGIIMVRIMTNINEVTIIITIIEAIVITLTLTETRIKILKSATTKIQAKPWKQRK
jgi:hypothetical protein